MPTPPATYEEIKDYVLEHSGLKVSIFYIAQIKQMVLKLLRLSKSCKLANTNIDKVQVLCYTESS